MEPAVSVIVPVYQVETFLDRCIQSILVQTFRNFELILVDDGSPDNSGAICDRYGARDSRIRVLHKKNGGAASARNAGMQQARGAYLAFVDGDDYIEPDMLERQYELAQKYQADVVCCGFGQQREPGPLPMPEQREVRVVGWKEFAPLLFQGELFYASFWNKLYRRELAGGLRNDEDIYFTEDRLANCVGLRYAARFVLDNTPRYHYMIWGDSMVQRSLSEKQFTALPAAQRVIDLAEGDPELSRCCRRQRNIIRMTLINRIIKADRFWDRYPGLRADLLSEYRSIMREEIYNQKERLTAFLLKYAPWVYKQAVRRAVRRQNRRIK